MFTKGTKVYSIFNNKCPKCHQGDFFEDSNPLHFKKILKMNTYCTHCGFKFQIEPSFFYGAMYISYGLTVGLSIIVFVIFYLLGLSLLYIFLAIFIALVLFTPLTLRLARLIYSNIFISYDPDYRNEEGLECFRKKS
ncbi:MAG TPA: DUF983 domain-containing protein [Flavobacteriia bacterium]|nr:DUF983 domain-containing protein [Flavobacteriia bacterium]